jgi:SAM-dependent methyltransferase
MKKEDPIGQAIEDYLNGDLKAQIQVASDLSDDDIIPAKYLFRAYNEMPALEQKAIAACQGEVLDVGCGAGAHLKVLKENNCTAEGIDISPKAIHYLKQLGLNANLENFLDYREKKYDTILMLMNGLGLAGDLQSLSGFLIHAKSLLKEGGKILCDSTDVRYFYEAEDGSLWIDLNAAYYGNFKFKMTYKNHSSGWFNWLYVDFETLCTHASEVGLDCSKIDENNDENTYLAELKIKS